MTCCQSDSVVGERKTAVHENWVGLGTVLSVGHLRFSSVQST